MWKNFVDSGFMKYALQNSFWFHPIITEWNSELWFIVSGGEPHGCTSFGDGYFVICRVDYGNKRNNRYKKARDFLRFG